MLISRWAPLAALALAGACRDVGNQVGPSSTGTITAVAPVSAPAPLAVDRGRHERLAEKLARAMRDPDFRRTVAQALDASPNREHKVHLQAFLDANGARERARMERLSGSTDGTVQADLDQSAAIEVYLPVPEHRRRW